MAASGRTSHPSSSCIPGTRPTNQEVGEKDASREGFRVELFWRWLTKIWEAQYVDGAAPLRALFSP